MDNLNNFVTNDSSEPEIINTEENISYDPNIDEDTEKVDLDTSSIGIFRIDERMPVELQEQLRKFNQKTESLNRIVSDISSDIDSPDYTVDSDFSDEGSTDDFTNNVTSVADTIQEDDNFEVGDLF
jgi:hypothetical protein